jgi:hypothetical protein
VKLILSREALITKLEDFERLASDPNRFFEKGTCTQIIPNYSMFTQDWTKLEPYVNSSSSISWKSASVDGVSMYNKISICLSIC